MKNTLLILLALALVSCATTASTTSGASSGNSSVSVAPANSPITLAPSTKGHVAFYFVAGLKYKETQTAFAEYIYTYEKSKSGLEAEGLTWSYHSRLPIEIENNGLTLSVGAKSLSQSAGVIFIKKGGKFRIVYGVYNHVDLVKMAQEYFINRRP